MTLPISVICPVLNRRREFFEAYVLPSIKANDPAEIWVEFNDATASGTGAGPRNAGLAKATQPLVFFCDDDVVLDSRCLRTLMVALLEARDWKVHESIVPGYAYCDYRAICVDPKAHPSAATEGPIFTVRSRPFDGAALRAGNFVSMMSLVVRSKLGNIVFDEQLRAYDDWDVWLALWNRKIAGVYVAETLFMAFYADAGITSAGLDATLDSFRQVQHKHGIRVGF